MLRPVRTAAQWQALQQYVLARPRRRGKSSLAVSGLVLRLLWKAWLSLLFQRKPGVEADPCDILLIHPSRKSFLQGRKKPLLEALQARGLRVAEFVEEGDSELMRDRQFVPPGLSVPFLLRWHAAHAAYLLQRYRPKVILTERNAWIVPSFIKALRGEGARVVHLAHSVPSAQSSHYDYFDYDYYLMFGASSFEYLASLKEGYGSCTAVFAGPYFLTDRPPPAEKPRAAGRRLLFLGSGPDYERDTGYQACCRWVMQWLAEHPDVELAVKVHPRGSGNPWVARAAVEARLRILPQDMSLDECAGQFDLVLCGYTNAVLDVARAGIPFVLLGAGEDYFAVERFELPRCLAEEQLSGCIDAVVAAPEEYERRLAAFLKFHIDQPGRPLASLVDCVERIVAGDGLPGKELLAASSRH